MVHVGSIRKVPFPHDQSFERAFAKEFKQAPRSICGKRLQQYRALHATVASSPEVSAAHKSSSMSIHVLLHIIKPFASHVLSSPRNLLLQRTAFLRLGLILIQPYRMLRLLNKALMCLAAAPRRLFPRRAVSAILVLVDVPLPTTTGVEVLVALGGAHRGLRDHVLGRLHRRARTRRRDHVARPATAGGVLRPGPHAGDTLAHDVAVDVGGVGVVADVAGA